jgi:ligand-binding sensor domain-containing protein
MSRYDGKNWNGYFDHDSGLASNFINFLRAEGPVVFVCSDNGLSSFNGKTWVTYKKNDNDENGKALVMKGTKIVNEIPLFPSISHNFIIGVDAEDGVLWVATSKGVCRGELIN